MERQIYITYEEWEEGGEVCEGDQDSSWPNYEPTYKTFSLKSAFKEDPESWHCEPIQVNFEIGNTVTVVVVRYTTGGTFGTNYGMAEIIGAYATPEEARKVEQSILDGTYQGYKCWEGYFESLEDVYYETLGVH